MKRLIMILAVCLALCGCTAKATETLRFHVVANSNSDFDQEVKIEVKNAVYEYIRGNLSGEDSMEETVAFVQDEKEELTEIANAVLKEKGADYEANIVIGRFEFPTKSYGEEVYPAGEYEAVKVELGKAQGENWWCVLFPPICFVDASNETDIDSSFEEKEVEFVSIFSGWFNKE